jgi:phage terminase small subunit
VGVVKLTETQGKIYVTYKYVDGVHFFVAADKKAAGLCVAHKELAIAYNEVAEQLSKIITFNSGKQVSYSPAIPFEEFKKIIEAYQAVTKLASDYDITPAATQSWIYKTIHKQDMETA